MQKLILIINTKTNFLVDANNHAETKILALLTEPVSESLRLRAWKYIITLPHD